MWIDTHCHLDAREFGAESPDVARRAAGLGVDMIVIPAVARDNFDIVRSLAATLPNASYALGIHPIYVPQATDDDLAELRRQVEASLLDPNFVAIGEIGLDFFIPMLCEPDMRAKQERFLREQLRIARDFGLPVLTHVRRSQDQVLKHVRQIRPAGGIAHAFNGSVQQAERFIALGFKLGFGGTLTFERALQVRRAACAVPPEAIVLETDAPDMPPHWLYRTAAERAQDGAAQARNEPGELPRIAGVLAGLRGETPEQLAAQTGRNARAALPRLEI